MEKWGGMRKKVGEGVKRVGDEERRGVDPEMKVEEGVTKGKTRIGKVFAEKIMGEISRRSARSVGKYRKKQGQSEFRG